MTTLPLQNQSKMDYFSIKPPFTKETAELKVQLVEDACNELDVEKVANMFSENSEWRNRIEYIKGRAEIKEFLQEKWANELEYKLKKRLWAYTENRISVWFEYEFQDSDGYWYRAMGNENWEFDSDGLVNKRFACINDMPINEMDRRVQ